MSSVANNPVVEPASDVEKMRGLGPVEALRRVLHDGRLGGAILVGYAGSGRRSIFDDAVAGLDPQPAVVHLNGSAYTAKTRYGVLSMLISRLDTPATASRHELVRAIADTLEDRTIVTLGSPELIDAESAAVLAQLAVMEKISLVIPCTRLSELPDDLSALYRSITLIRIDVPGMNVSRSKAFLEAELEGPVTMLAAAAIWRMCGASRDLMRQLAREFVAHGRLRVEGGWWILVPVESAPNLVIRAPQLANLTSGEHRVLQSLAVGGPASLAALRRCGMAEDVSNLRSRGLVTVVESWADSVHINVPLFARLLREQVDESDLVSIERVLTELHGDDVRARLMTRALAMRDLGDDASVVAAIEDFESSGGFRTDAWHADPVRLSIILEIQFWALVALGRRLEAGKCVERARPGLDEVIASGVKRRDLARAEQLVGLLTSQAVLIQDRPGDEADLTRELWEADSLHVKALTVQSEAWAMGKRQREALSIADSVESDMTALRLSGVLNHVLTPEQCADIECTLVRVRLLCGEWEEAARSARSLAEGRYPVPHAIAFGSLATGLLSALSHDTEEALDTLLPAAHQLTALSAGVLPAAARAAAAFSVADRGRDDVVPDAHDDTPRPVIGGFLGWVAEIFDYLRRGRHDPDGSIALLVELADRCKGAGFQVLEMATLATAMRLGDTSSADRLYLLASNSSAPPAAGYARLARGVANGDGASVAGGLDLLISHGQLLFSHGEGSALVDGLDPRARRRILATGYQDSAGRAATPPEPEQPRALQAWLAHLTKREMQIAEQAIAGMTNSAIARANGVSVRTVEGHLYQVYSKLHVRNRQELTAIARTHRET